MYFLSIKRYNLEYTKSEKTREWDQSRVVKLLLGACYYYYYSEKRVCLLLLLSIFRVPITITLDI